MFEAILTLCLATGDTCRPVLLPGYEAADRTGCEQRLQDSPPDISTLFTGLTASGTPSCQPTGNTLDFTEAAPGLFVHLGKVAEPDFENAGDVSNLGFIIGDSSVAVIDGGSARWMGEGVWRAIRARTDLPVSHAIVTHMHPDHALGISVFADAGAQIVGHRALDRALADRRENYFESLSILIGPDRFIGTETAATDLPINDVTQIDLGGRTLSVQAWPRSHTGSDLTVLDTQTGILFTGDLVFDDHTPALDGSLIGWQSVLSDLIDLPVRQIVPGHGGPILDWPQGATALQRYLDVLAADTRAAIDQGQRLGDAIETIAASEAPHWRLFEAYNPRNATVAFTELEWE
ncbi:quinoprotein relay system zinc metallohydrolase 2 [uncultured Roseovarius sp.]|uniref:quinoprotein relay system zinc metallohydrolase 2 n=1 Tax=uncultured Roseovarius sp. TaxID=293344 RepID=UPI0026265693|nr:quinoprotein relay system zinc metallohydrolase 2 [uncultured Roseovarius sp.]